MSEGKPSQVHIRTRKEQSFDVLEVEDTGPGVAVADREKVFDAFYTTKESGLGVGLSISRTIINLVGGRIWIEDAQAGGAKFCVALPADAGAPSQIEQIQ